jgi:hypothetical protein
MLRPSHEGRPYRSFDVLDRTVRRPNVKETTEAIVSAADSRP